MAPDRRQQTGVGDYKRMRTADSATRNNMFTPDPQDSSGYEYRKQGSAGTPNVYFRY